MLEDENASMSPGEHFEAELDTSALETALEWKPVEVFQYGPFVAEEEVNKEEDGPFPVEMRQSMVGIRENLQ